MEYQEAFIFIMGFATYGAIDVCQERFYKVPRIIVHLIVWFVFYLGAWGILALFGS